MDTFTPAHMLTFFDVNFFPLFQFDIQREAAEHTVRSGGGTSPLRQERPHEPGSTAVWIRDGILGVA